MIVSLEKYESDRFCPNCGMLLRSKRLKIDRVRAAKKKECIEIHRDDINIDSLWYEYIHYSPIDVGGGVVFETVDSWIIIFCDRFALAGESENWTLNLFLQPYV